LVSQLQAQNIHPPRFERYLFSATSDGAQGLRLNPANIGFPHRNLLIYLSQEENFSFKNYNVGFFFQSMRFGFGLDRIKIKDTNSILISTSTGFGSEDFTFGLGFDYLKINDDRFKPSINVGLLSRPFNFVSISIVIQNLTGKYFQGTSFEKRYIIGAGLRPFGNDRLTLSGDLFIQESQKTKNFKYGAELKIIDGVNIYAIFDNSKIFSDKKSYIFGLSINLQNTGIKLFNDFENSKSERSTISAFYSAEVMKTSIYPSKKVAEIEIRGVIPDYKEQPSLFSRPRKSLHDIIDEIEKSANDKDINGLILKIHPFSGELKLYELEGLTQELVDAVIKVKKSGKPVVAYLVGEMASVNELYLASVADKIVIHPLCLIVGYGTSIDVARLKSFFEKLGIEWDAMTAGEFKSTFHSTYTDSATPKQAQLIKGLVDEIHKQMVEQITKSRNITLTDELIEEISGGLTPPRAKEIQIVDEIGTYEDAKKLINKLANNREDEKIKTVNLSKRRYWNTNWGIVPKIAVIGVHGTITSGKSQPPDPFFGERTTGSETVVKQINSAVKDKGVKAIILRVNSGGGSAFASEEIYNALKKAKEKKPVIVSFGNIAASGGYYVSCSSDKIFANPATLTGSIGVVFSKPVVEKLYENFKVKIERYKKGEHSDLFSITRHWTDEEKNIIENALQYTYLGFKQRVAQNRKMTLDEVEELAQGKVYVGTKALEIKLVDELGGLRKAIEFAKEKAKIKDIYQIKFYTVPTFFGLPNGFYYLFDFQ
jgi:protease-4